MEISEDTLLTTYKQVAREDSSFPDWQTDEIIRLFMECNDYRIQLSFLIGLHVGKKLAHKPEGKNKQVV
ncbi:MAG: hypothetical protein QXV82_09315 [Ignisphaera sp.]